MRRRSGQTRWTYAAEIRQLRERIADLEQEKADLNMVIRAVRAELQAVVAELLEQRQKRLVGRQACGYRVEPDGTVVYGR